MTDKTLAGTEPAVEKEILSDEKVHYVVELINSGTDEDISKINKLITQYKFSSLKLAEIIKLSSLQKFMNVNVGILHPKVVVRVIACCVNVINLSRDVELVEKCQKILDGACERLYYVNFGNNELLELADIDYNKVTDYLVSISNNFDLQAKILLSEENANHVVDILTSGDIEKLKTINQMIEEYKFSHDRLAYILLKTPIELLENMPVDFLNTKIIIRAIACAVFELKRNRELNADERDRFERVYNKTYGVLQNRNLTTDDYLELARIPDEKLLQIANVSNHFGVQNTVIETSRLAGITLRT
jgi:hypothetical protein